MSWLLTFIFRVAIPVKVHSPISNFSQLLPPCEIHSTYCKQMNHSRKFIFSFYLSISKDFCISPLWKKITTKKVKTKNKNPEFLSWHPRSFSIRPSSAHAHLSSRMLLQNIFIQLCCFIPISEMYLTYMSLFVLALIFFSLEICPPLHFRFITSTSGPSL